MDLVVAVLTHLAVGNEPQEDAGETVRGPVWAEALEHLPRRRPVRAPERDTPVLVANLRTPGRVKQRRTTALRVVT